MKLLITTDVHDREDLVKRAAENLGVDAIVDGGDHNGDSLDSLFQDIPRYFIHGNHEPRDVRELAKAGEQWSNNNLHYMPSGMATEIPTDSDPVRILCWGGNFSSEYWKGQEVKKPELRMSKEQYSSLHNQKGPFDFFLTHEPASATNVTINWKDKKPFNPGLGIVTNVAEYHKVPLQISGHYHTNHIHETPETTYVALHTPQFQVGVYDTDSKQFQIKKLDTDY